MSTEIKPGYKMTEAGVIPEDWNMVTAGQIGRFRGGNGFPLKFQREATGSYPFFKVSDMNNEGNETMMLVANNYISEIARKTLGATIFAENSIVFAKVGAAIFLERKRILAQPSCLDNNMTAFELDDKKADYRFVHHRLIHTRLSELVSTTALPSLSGSILSQIKFPLPPLEEQRAIAITLSDVDLLLTEIDRLIAKKRDIQQATMQQLLTGQRRLPGFGGEWKVKRLGEIATIKTGSKNNQDKIEDGEYPFYVRSATVERINSYSHDGEAILVPGEGGIGSIFHYINGRFDVHQRVYAITNFSVDVSGKYVHLYMSTRFGAHAMQNSVKATVDSLRLPTFLVFEVLLPPTKEEQTAIAAILIDMDSELAALEARRDKALQIKQGMMQDLLTGRTRLI
jgi:type I restriction enzyme S subunit